MKIFAVVILALVAAASANPLFGIFGGGSSSSSSSSSGGVFGGIANGITGAVTGVVGGVLTAVTAVTGLAGGLVQTATALTGGVIATAIGLVEGAVGVLGGLTLLAGGLVAGVVGALSLVLSGLLIAFTEILTTFDITGILKSVIEIFTTSVVAITSGVSFCSGSSSSSSSSGTTNLSGSGGSNTIASGASGNGSLDYIHGVALQLEVVLKYIFGFKTFADFNLQAVFSELVNIIRQLAFVFGQNITGTIVQVFNQIQGLAQAVIKAFIAQDFQAVEKISIQILYTLNVLLDLVVSFAAYISGGIQSASPAVTDAFNVSIGMLFSVVSCLFTTLQTVTVAAQGSLYQIIQGAGNADQAVIKAAQVALANLIDLAQIVVTQIGGFIASSVLFAKDSSSYVSINFSSKLNDVVSGSINTFGGFVLKAFNAFSSVTGFTVKNYGQISASVFGNLNIANEANSNVQYVVSSGITTQSGLSRPTIIQSMV